MRLTRLGGPAAAPMPLILVIISFCTNSCAPLPVPRTPEELEQAVSALILQPERTCAQLRADFGVGFLPVVEYPDELGSLVQNSVSGPTYAAWGRMV